MADGGHIHMNGQQVAPILGGLRTDAMDLATAWETAQGEIAGHEAGMGTGPLGTKFAAIYDPPAQEVRVNASRVPVELGTTVDVGYQVMAEYIATDQVVADSFARGGARDDTFATGI
jgi:hypothetical protein